MAGPCSYATTGELRGEIGKPAVELSGMGASRTQFYVLWGQNDSGNAPELYAFDTTGRSLSSFRVVDERGDDVVAQDWEDLAMGGTPAAPLVYIGDVGDNLARETRGKMGRAAIAVYAIAEPDARGPVTTVVAERYEFTYPDAPHDCESMFVDPRDGALYFIAKEDSPAAVFRALPPFVGGERRLLEKVGTIDFTLATAADITTDGSRVAVRGYLDVKLYDRAAGQSLVDALQAPLEIRPSEVAAEAIAFEPAGPGYYSAPEGEGPELWFTRCN